MAHRTSQSTVSRSLNSSGRRGVLGTLSLLLAVLVGAFVGSAEADALTGGPVLVGQDTVNDTGKVRQYGSDGAFGDVLETPAFGGQQTGMCFDAGGNLYTTNFLAFSVSKFAPSGALVAASFVDVSPATPNSCVFDAAGNLYVGLSDADGIGGSGAGAGGLLKFSLAGPTPTLVAVYHPMRDATVDFSGRGTDWIDLAPDQCTMLYTSIGNSIKRFDVCANPQTPPALSGSQLADYCGPCDDGNGGQVGPFLGFRILLGGGGVLVADNGAFTEGVVRRYDGNVVSGTGTHVETYAGEDALGSFCGVNGDAPCFFPFALNLDPDGVSFWTADNATSEVFRFAIGGPGTPMQPRFCGAEECDDFTHFVTGLAVVGELTAATQNTGTTAASVTPDANSKVYGQSDPALTGTLSGFVPADDVTATYSRTAGEAVGTYTISATLSPANVLGNYSITYNTAVFAITKADPAVTAAGNSCVYSGNPCAGSGTATGVQNEALTPVTLTYRDAGNVVLGGAPVAAGTYTVVASYAGDSTYNAKDSTPATITIAKVDASVTPNAAGKVYGTADPAFSGTLTGFLAADNVTATYSRAAGESVAGSPYTISATLSPAGVLGNYNVTYNTANFTITAATATVAPNAASKVYGAADPAFSGTLSGFLPADGVTATYNRTAGESVAGSPYTISATLSPAGVLGNYNVTYNTANFTITAAAVTVTPDAASKVYGAADPALTGTLSGFLPADGITATYSRTAGESVAGSPYTISATLSPAGALANYTVTYNTANFTITKATASVTPNAASKSYGAADPALTGTLSGLLPADGITATYSRTAGESVAGSPYLISAVLSPAGALANYTVTYNTASFTIVRIPASVTPNAASKVYGTADPVLTGSVAGFLAGDGVTAAHSRAAGENVLGSPYLISSVLSPPAALGNYAITYNTANFTITPATPIITWADPADITYPAPLSGTQLNATANVSGTFTYTPPAGTVLNVGNGQLLSVLLTPTDSGNYTTATAQVHINVLAATSAACPEDPTAVLTSAVDDTGAAHGSVPVYTTVQAAYNAAQNGAVIGMFSQTNENVTLGGAKSLTITQCTVAKITASDSTQPVWNVTSTGALTIIGPDAVGGSIGWRIATSNHTVKSVRSTGASQYGILVIGNNNSVSVNSVSGSPVGIRVTGNSNDLRPGGAVSGNSGNGVEVAAGATGNTVRIGNIQSNGGNGVQVDGSGNTITSNGRVDSNTLTGILVNGSNNTIKSNAAGSDKGKGNGQAGLKVVGGGNTLDSNAANANGGVGFDLVGAGNKLKGNQANQTAQGGNKENTGCEYRFADGTTVDQGSNKKDNASFVGSLSGPKYAAGCYE